MAWNCINCESANDFSRNSCEVCGYERYYSITEVNQLLEYQQESPSDVKKVEANYKRANTNNKKLRQENKELNSQMQELQDFYDNYNDEMKAMESEVNFFRKTNLRLKIWLTVAIFVILFLIFAKVSVLITF